jgi:hypothetical protein
MTAPVFLPPGVTSRLAEKTVELNFPRQVGALLRTGFWFGLTQLQEAQNGYDAAVTLGGGVCISSSSRCQPFACRMGRASFGCRMDRWRG